MKKSLIVIFLLSIVTLQGRAGNVAVRFETHALTLYPFTKVFIVGSFNKWSPDDSAYILHPTGKDNYTLELTLPEGKPVEYKYTLGGWMGVEKQSEGTDRDNRKLIAAKGLVRKDTVLSWAIDGVNRGRWFADDLTFLQLLLLNKEFLQEQREANTTTAFDILIDRVQSRWNKEYAVHFSDVTTPITLDENHQSTPHQTGSAILSSHLYAYLLARPTGWASHMDVFDYVFSAYWLPAFLDEYSYYVKEPNNTELASWLPDGRNVFNIALFAPLPEAEWEKIYRLHNDMFALLDTCLSQISFKRTRMNQGLFLLKDDLQASKVFWEINNALYSGNTSAASERLAQYLQTDTARMLSAGAFALKVVKRCIEEKQNEEACDALDMLLASTDDSFIPRDTLRTYYIQADPSKGLSRYEHAAMLRHKIALVPKDSTRTLSGTYRNILSGKDFRLDSLKGKIVLVDVWTTWCRGCRRELPDLKKFAEAIKTRNDFVLVTICGDPVEQGRNEAGIKSFATEFSLNYPVLADVPSRSFIHDFDINGFPTKLLFDTAGRLLMRSEDGLTIETVEAYLANRDLK